MEQNELELWLNSLKVGDKVAIESRYYGDKTYEISKITKITKTRQMEVDDISEKYKNGVAPGSWGRSRRIVPITQDVKDYLEMKKLMNAIGSIKLNELNLDQLRQIKAILGK